MFAAGVMDAHDADPLAYDFNKHYKNVTTLAAAQLARVQLVWEIIWGPFLTHSPAAPPYARRDL